MTIEEGATKIGTDTLQLFVRAHKMYGHMWGQGSASDGHARWKKQGIVPMYVAQYLRYLERQVVVVNGSGS